MDKDSCLTVITFHRRVAEFHGELRIYVFNSDMLRAWMSERTENKCNGHCNNKISAFEAQKKQMQCSYFMTDY